MTGTNISRRTLIGGAAAAAGAAPLAAVGMAGAATTFALDDTMNTDAAWAAYLGGLDPVWTRIPTNFYQSAFVGNGGLAASLFQTGTAKRLSLRLGDSRVRDHQGTGGTNFGNARLPVGELLLNTSGDVTGVDLRLSLWNAEVAGTVTTSKGSLNIRVYTHATRDVIVAAASVRSGTERVQWTFTPAVARSPRLDFHPAPAGLKTNPKATVSGTTCTQNLAAGGQTVTKWQTRSEAGGTTLMVTVAHTFPGTNAGTVASATLDAAGGKSLDELTAEHRAWWHAFYPKSFVSVAETRLESFYWIQLYKMACATRRDRPVLGTCGPWVEKTPWPGTWWNLNVQLEYWLINATSHPELDSVSASLTRYRDNLTANVPSAYRSDSAGIARTTQEDCRGNVAQPGASGDPEVGNLTWALHNAYLAYRHSMDDGVLRDFLFPVLRRAVNYYLHFLTRDSGGTYHLPKTFSPEYASSRDCNYDLALIHWGVGTLLASAKRLGIADPLASKWQDVLDHLVKPPQDADGFKIGADVKLTSGHRHYSHLLWFYPLYRLDVTTSAANRTALTKSLDHWLGFSSAKQGYTFTGSGSMYAILGNGNQARTQMITLLDKYVQANTMYKEAGPVIETPLSGAQTMHDMLVQSWGTTIRVFPGVPSAWADATVHNFRTEGAFLVSAVRKAGRTEFVRVKSLAGEPCRVLPGGLAGPYDVRAVADGAAVPFTTNSDGSLQITLAKDADVVITTRGSTPAFRIAPAGTNTKRYWGLP
jgi:alpha-L-fucosidase 2